MPAATVLPSLLITTLCPASSGTLDESLTTIRATLPGGTTLGFGELSQPVAASTAAVSIAMTRRLRVRTGEVTNGKCQPPGNRSPDPVSVGQRAAEAHPQGRETDAYGSEVSEGQISPR